MAVALQATAGCSAAPDDAVAQANPGPEAVGAPSAGGGAGETSSDGLVAGAGKDAANDTVASSGGGTDDAQASGGGGTDAAHTSGDGSARPSCPLHPTDTWLPIPDPPFPLGEPPDVGFPGAQTNWLVGTRGEQVYVLDRGLKQVAVFDTCAVRWSVLDHDPAQWQGLYFFNFQGGYFVTAAGAADDTLMAMDPEDGSVQELPRDFAQSLDAPAGVTGLIEPAVPNIPSSASAASATGSDSVQWVIDVGTGTKWVRWGLVQDRAEGCDDLPADFVGGCDPLYRRSAYPGGGMYTPRNP